MTAQTPLKVVMTDFDKLNQLYNQTERVWLKENEIFIDIYLLLHQHESIRFSVRFSV